MITGGPRGDTLPFRNDRVTALLTDHAHLATRSGEAIAYLPAVGPWAAVERDHPPAWEDLRRVTSRAVVERSAGFEPTGWRTVDRSEYLVMVGDRPSTPTDTAGVRVLREHDLPAIARLAADCGATMFSEGAFAMGHFRGVFDHDRLVAMAGTRGSTPTTWEVAAVATVPDHRRRGLSAAVVSATREAAEATGRTAFLHVAPDNVTAVRLYERLGFSVHGEPVVVDELVALAPATGPTSDGRSTIGP